MTATEDPIQSLWIGPRLSAMERLAIASFLSAGHTFHLYTYGETEGVPEGAEIRDGNEILPSERIFLYPHRPSYSGFSNFFRYKLLLERGGWWVDTDVICLRPFDFAAPYVFSAEPDPEEDLVASAVLKAPAGSEIMDFAWQRCRASPPETLAWGVTGPRLVTEAVRRFACEHAVEPAEVFCPIGYRDWQKVLEAESSWRPGPVTHAVHLWNEMWRQKGHDKNDAYPPGCLYERLKARFLDPGGEKSLASAPGPVL